MKQIQEQLLDYSVIDIPRLIKDHPELSKIYTHRYGRNYTKKKTEVNKSKLDSSNILE